MNAKGFPFSACTVSRHGAFCIARSFRLSKIHRVVVSDDMGFGKSESPQGRPYTAQAHTNNLELLVKHPDLRNTTLVAHDWGGQIRGALALR
jgi:pimeloyl-ACP methyl ester carboxylesterase